MGMVSAAETTLDARVRPELTLHRTRTSYPARPVLATLSGTPARPPARPVRPAASVPDDAARFAGPVLPAATRPAAAVRRRPTVASTPAPVRLTSRGRFVVGLVASLGAIAAVAALWLAVAGRAEAAGHVQYPGRGTAGMARVIVAPGQSLWTIALRVDPTADPRIIVAEIITDNSLTGQTIQPGQALWVPRG
jgi:hypothetical protein